MKIPTHEKNPWLKNQLLEPDDAQKEGRSGYGFGRAMLAKFGWQLGDGLGRDPKTGLKSSIQLGSEGLILATVFSPSASVEVKN